MPPQESVGHTDELIASLYPQLRRIAAARMAQETPGHTLQPTALVHEAWMRLSTQEAASWGSPTQFFAAASETMRRILVDHARHRARLKRGGDWVRVSMDVTDSVPISADEKLILIHEARRPGPRGRDASPDLGNALDDLFPPSLGRSGADARLGFEMPRASRSRRSARHRRIPLRAEAGFRGRSPASSRRKPPPKSKAPPTG